MIFQSLTYLVFLALVFVLYWSVPRRWQNWLLLVASYVFYGWVHPWYGILMATTTLVDFSAARWIAAMPQGAKGRKWVLASSLFVTFSILCWFKYYNFFAEAFYLALTSLGLDVSQSVINVLLPVGISFYTFQSASYVVDTFRGKQEPCKYLPDYALYVAFFPQLVAGPIERADHLLGQVRGRRVADPLEMRRGICLIVWGMLQKLVIADNAGLLANRAFSIEETSFPIVWGGVIAFGVQIFADFSAYTDIARGSAKLLGFDLRINFLHPYTASSPSDFWRRWHMSLSTWFRDYVYIPLGGSRAGHWRVAFNLLLTFALSGLWHGSNWNFLLWGVFHGALVAGQHLLGYAVTKEGRPWWVSLFGWALTFVLMHVGWLMFREQNPEYLKRYFSLSPVGVSTADWEVGLYFVAFAQLMALPLWIQTLLERVVLPKWGKNWGSGSGGGEPRTGRGGFGAESRVWDGLGAGPHKRVFYGLQLLFVVVGCCLIYTLRAETSADFIYFQF